MNAPSTSAQFQRLFGDMHPRKAIRTIGFDALEDVMAERDAQTGRGYTAAADDQKPVREFINLLELLAGDIRAAHPMQRSQRDLAEARRMTIRLAATAIALAERLDRLQTLQSKETHDET